MILQVRDNTGNVFATRLGLTVDEALELAREWLEGIDADSNATMELIGE